MSKIKFVKLNDVKIELANQFKKGNISLTQIEKFLGNLKIYTKQEVRTKNV